MARYYNIEDIYLVGNSTSNKDLSDSFATDNNIITILTALFVMVILLFTFQSAGLPVLLVVTIQGSIWMNFSLPYLTGEVVYFLGYLVVSAIQMGATIDYAIVITSRYMELKTYMPIKKAIVETLNQAFPTIVTSGSMLVAAGFIISNVSTNAVVAAIGLALGRGTLTSIGLVLLALPQTLLIGDIIIEKTAFTLKRDITRPLPTGGRIRMSGHIKGYVNGVIDGEFSGVIDGEMGAVVRAKDTVEQLREELPEGEVPEEPPQLEAVEIEGPGEAGNDRNQDTEAGTGPDREVAEPDTAVASRSEREVAEPDTAVGSGPGRKATEMDNAWTGRAAKSDNALAGEAEEARNRDTGAGKGLKSEAAQQDNVQTGETAEDRSSRRMGPERKEGKEDVRDDAE